MTSAKISIARLVDIAFLKGIRDVVFSPGSRNAPLVIAFVESNKFNCKCIPDERVAAFYAMGMSLQSQKPTIICCTSGSAALNYAPAICEAFYQYIPLLVITADRPVEWIDQGVGQSIRQNNIYHNYVKGAYQFIQDARGADDIWYNDRVANEAINKCMSAEKGPVHLNIPMREPLYEMVDTYDNDVKIVMDYDHKASLSEDSLNELFKIWKTAKQKIILAGLSAPNTEVTKLLEQLVQDESVVLLTETCSNAFVEGSVQCIDRVIQSFDNDEAFHPDLVLTFGGPIISKKIIAFFQKNKPKFHWDLRSDKGYDTFQALTHKIDVTPQYFLSKLLSVQSPNNIDFQDNWNIANRTTRQLHMDHMAQCEYSDLKVFDVILNNLTPNLEVHLSNSAIVRYAQLFDQNAEVNYYANRGVSGIDGCTSTALGFASLSKENNLFITGDMAFLYDSNAFWHKHLPLHFKIIIVNNSGGGIFRFISGPDTTNQLDQYFEATHETDARHLAEMYGLKYQAIRDLKGLEKNIPGFINDSQSGIQIMEIFTPRIENSQVLKSYFGYLKSHFRTID